MIVRLSSVPLCAAIFSVALARAAEPPPSEPAPPPAPLAPPASPAQPAAVEGSSTPPSTQELTPPYEAPPPAPDSKAAELPEPPPAPLMVPPGPRARPRAEPVPTLHDADRDGGHAGDGDAGAAEDGQPQAVSPRLALSAGLRTLFVLGDGYEPFAERAALWSAALGGSVRVHEDRELSVVVGLVWDIGYSESRARSAETGLDFQRLTAVPEVRYRLAPRLVAYGRAGIGAGYVHATYQDAVIAEERGDDAFLFTADAGVGLAVHLGRRRGARGVWLSLDGGYLWTSSANLALQSENVPARAEPLHLEQLSLHGPYTKLSAALGF